MFLTSLHRHSHPSSRLALTCPCRRISLAPPPAQWRRCRRRCASARSPWWVRPSYRWWRRGRRGRWSRAGRSARRRTRWPARRWHSPGKPANTHTHTHTHTATNQSHHRFMSTVLELMYSVTFHRWFHHFGVNVDHKDTNNHAHTPQRCSWSCRWGRSRRCRWRWSRRRAHRSHRSDRAEGRLLVSPHMPGLTGRETQTQRGRERERERVDTFIITRSHQNQYWVNAAFRVKVRMSLKRPTWSHIENSPVFVAFFQAFESETPPAFSVMRRESAAKIGHWWKGEATHRHTLQTNFTI